jgi:hypothetical protein
MYPRALNRRPLPVVLPNLQTERPFIAAGAPSPRTPPSPAFSSCPALSCARHPSKVTRRHHYAFIARIHDVPTPGPIPAWQPLKLSFPPPRPPLPSRVLISPSAVFTQKQSRWRCSSVFPFVASGGDVSGFAYRRYPACICTESPTILPSDIHISLSRRYSGSELQM